MNNKIYLKTITVGSMSIAYYLIKLCKELKIEYKKTRFGFYAELFGTGKFYCLKTYINESGKFPKGTFDVYADVNDTFSNCSLKADEIYTYELGLDVPNDFEAEVKSLGIWYYTDGEMYWIGPDSHEADLFESILRRKNLSINHQEVAA